MAAPPRPKSPRPLGSAIKSDKEESFWEKIGTLGRKKRIKEGQFTLNQNWRLLQKDLTSFVALLETGLTLYGHTVL